MNHEEAVLKLKGSENPFFGKDLLLTWNLDDRELGILTAAASLLKGLHALGRLHSRLLPRGLAISIFRDKSTRTRFAFAMGASLLGLTPVDLDEEKTQVSHGETTRETAVMVSFATAAIGVRDDLYLGEGHAYMKQVAAALDEAKSEGVLPCRPTVVNLQCDLDHPTQTLSDLLHVADIMGSTENLKGKKIAVTWAYSPSYGKPLSVPQGLLALMTRFGMHVVLAHPPGYELLPEVLEVARRNARASGGRLEIVDSMDEAFEDADFVYPKSWAPLWVMRRRVEFLREGNRQGLRDLERECLEHNAKFRSWTCSADLMSRTRNATYMHCLPAEISGVNFPEGEVDREVFEAHRLATYRQASYKPFVIAAAILFSQRQDAADCLLDLWQSRARPVPE